jgi:hypothetical protein
MINYLVVELKHLTIVARLGFTYKVRKTEYFNNITIIDDLLQFIRKEY